MKLYLIDKFGAEIVDALFSEIEEYEEEPVVDAKVLFSRKSINDETNISERE